jgi:hypothetical protein
LYKNASRRIDGYLLPKRARKTEALLMINAPLDAKKPQLNKPKKRGVLLLQYIDLKGGETCRAVADTLSLQWRYLS